MSARKVAIAIGVVLVLFFAFKSCGGSPESRARDTVEDFISAVRDKEGKDAVKLLYPPFRDALVQEVKIPVQLTEMKPSELLACTLSTMGENIKKVKYMDTKKIDENHVEVLLKITDKEGVDKILSFILIKDEKRWKIASISPLR